MLQQSIHPPFTLTSPGQMLFPWHACWISSTHKPWVALHRVTPFTDSAYSPVLCAVALSRFCTSALTQSCFAHWYLEVGSHQQASRVVIPAPTIHFSHHVDFISPCFPVCCCWQWLCLSLKCPCQPCCHLKRCTSCPPKPGCNTTFSKKLILKFPLTENFEIGVFFICLFAFLFVLLWFFLE